MGVGQVHVRNVIEALSAHPLWSLLYTQQKIKNGCGTELWMLDYSNN